MRTLQKYLFGIILVIGICSILILHNQTFAGNKMNGINIGEQVRVYSKILNEERIVLIYLPETYYTDSVSYPVLYLLDGGFHFFHTAGIVQFLSVNGLIPNTIVVAITNVDRGRDFSPARVKDLPGSGGAEMFHSFLTDELIPMIKTGYRTGPYRILAGHSLGGAFAVWSLLKHPDTFRAYIAISPYLQLHDEMLVRMSKKELSPELLQDKSFYMTLGNEQNYVPAINRFVSEVEKQKTTNFQFDYIRMKDETHGSIPHLSIYRGLEFIFSDWVLPADIFADGLAAIDKHYEKASKKYGYPITTPEQTINLLGYQYLQNDVIGQAINHFQENVKRHPSSANVYDSLGEAYEQNNQLELAEKNYASAVKLADLIHHRFIGIYKNNLHRVQKLLTNNLLN